MASGMGAGIFLLITARVVLILIFVSFNHANLLYAFFSCCFKRLSKPDPEGVDVKCTVSYVVTVGSPRDSQPPLPIHSCSMGSYSQGLMKDT